MSNLSLESVELPSIKTRTHCVLIARDPDYIYAYWDYLQEDFNRHRYEFLKVTPQLILRIYDITGIHFNGFNAKYSWDIPIDGGLKKKYIQVWQDNAVYCVELGLLNKNRFIPLTRSNTVRTPPKSFSKRDDLIWQDIKVNLESKPFIKEEIPGQSQEIKPHHSKKHLAPLPKFKSPRIYHLSAQDIRNYYKQFLTHVSRRHKDRVISIADVVKGFPESVNWQKVAAINTHAQWSIAKAHPGASEGVLTSEGPSGASENLAGLGASEGRLQQRQFFFEVWAELIVHGRSEADATVWLNNQEIKLNPDGSFTLRYALPDGEIPLKFIAQSSDGVEQRHLYTQVEREKTISFPKMLKEYHGKSS